MGSRVIRINLKALTSLMRWPFVPGTTVVIKENRLPEDCAFVSIERIEPPFHAIVRLASRAWRGDNSEELPQPLWQYDGPQGRIRLPTSEDIATLKH